MTAVAPPPNLQPISQVGWTGPNSTHGGYNSVGADDVSRMVVPRKGPARTNSSSSLTPSTSSSSSILSTASFQNNRPQTATDSDSSSFYQRKPKPTRGLWPPSKSEPISGISTARPQSVATTSSGPSAASAISALHTPSSLLPTQNSLQSQSQTNGSVRGPAPSEPPAILHLLPINGTFERKTITVPYWPDVLRVGRQTNQKTIPTPLNGYFDSKVLSRQHAEVWADRDGKIWIRDVKSSNGTFVNGQRLSQENRDSEPHELREQDVLELGIDIVSEDQKTVVHHKVAARVEYAGIYGSSNNLADLNLDFSDLDPVNSNLLMPQSFTNPLGPPIRGRTGSQGSLGSGGRLGAVGAGMPNGMTNMHGQPRHMSFWLTPVSMEQIVKRLNSEIRSARQQSQDLQRTEYFITNVLSNDHKAGAMTGSQSVNMKQPLARSDLKARFSEPPVPPPQQPLPEKPDAAIASSALKMPLLRRTETEKPKLNSINSTTGTSENPHQINSLVEALTSATKELDSQSSKLRDLEHLLAQERLARQSAEERAEQIENEWRSEQNVSVERTRSHQKSKSALQLLYGDASSDTSGSTLLEDEMDAKNLSGGEISSDQFQKRHEMMLAQMSNMMEQMKEYKQRAEAAEEESAKSRRTLAEMVERIRADDDGRPTRKGQKSHRAIPLANSDASEADSAGGPRENGTVMHSKQTKPTVNGHVPTAKAILEKVGLQHGRPVSPQQFAELEKDVSQALAVRVETRNEQLLQSAPYASIVGVVIIGVGLMAYLNGWQKVDT